MFTFVIALTTSVMLTPLVIAWARKCKLVDPPNVRKIHQCAIARVGGIAIFFSALLGILPVLFIDNRVGDILRDRATPIGALLVAGILVFLVGLFDDLKQIRVRTKLIVQMVAAIIVCVGGVHIDRVIIRDLVTIQLGGFGCAITFLWIVGITNAMNLIDGLDGLAAGISLIACGAMALMAILQGNVVLAIVMLSLVGSLVGFLFYNFHPAKIFMGDCGSLFLGFVIATVSIMTAAKSEALVGIGLPILVLGIPIFDTLLSMLRRFLNRRGIMSADRSHFHHRLVDMGLKQRHVAIFAYVVTTVVTGFGLLLMLTHGATSIVLLLCCIFLLLLVFRLVGAVELRRTFSGIRRRAELFQKKQTDRKKFEAAQLRFENVSNFDQWWGCVCETAEALDFDRLSIDIIGENVKKQYRSWTSEERARADHVLEDLLEVKLPVFTANNAWRGNLEIKVRKNGSLETVGRRIAFFTRLADEYSVDEYLPVLQGDRVTV